MSRETETRVYLHTVPLTVNNKTGNKVNKLLLCGCNTFS